METFQSIWKSMSCLFSVLLIVSCTPMVHTSMEKGTDFKSYRTYAWEQPDVKTGDNPKYSSEMVNNNIVNTVERELQTRGFVKNNNNPDLLIKYHTYTEKKRTSSFYGNYNPYFLSSPYFNYIGYGWGGYGWAYPYSYMGGYGSGGRYQEYTQGSLILDFKDRETNQVVWQGAIEGDVENVRSIAATVEKAVTAIMKRYPVQPAVKSHIQEATPVI